MDFYGNLNTHLLKQVQSDTKLLNTAFKDAETFDGDIAFFGDLVKQQKLSIIAFNEQTRSRHMLLKTALDGVQ